MTVETRNPARMMRGGGTIDASVYDARVCQRIDFHIRRQGVLVTVNQLDDTLRKFVPPVTATTSPVLAKYRISRSVAARVLRAYRAMPRVRSESYLDVVSVAGRSIVVEST